MELLEHVTSTLSMVAEMAILILRLQTNVFLPVVDSTTAPFHLVHGGATSSRTRHTAWPVTLTAGTAWAPPAHSVYPAATKTTIY